MSFVYEKNFCGVVWSSKVDSVFEAIAWNRIFITLDFHTDIGGVHKRMIDKNKLVTYVQDRGEHSKLYKKFPVEIKADEYYYNLCNCILHIKEDIKELKVLLKMKFYQRSITKRGHENIGYTINSMEKELELYVKEIKKELLM